MQAIVTKYIGATNTKPSRIKATCDAGSVTVSYSYDGDAEYCHRQAVNALLKKLGWDTPNYGEPISGGLPGNGGYVFVFPPKDHSRKDNTKELLSTVIGLLEILDTLNVSNEVTTDAKELVYSLTNS